MTQYPQYPQDPNRPLVPPPGVTTNSPPRPSLPDPGQPEYRGKPGAPKKPHTTRNLVLVGVGGLILGLVIGSAGSSTSSPDAAAPAPTVTVTAPNTGPSPDPVVTPTNKPAPPPKAVAPTVKDFKLTVKTLTKQCFGSAGCNVTFRILVTYNGPTLDPSKTYEVLYTVRGGEDPIENKLTVEGGESSVDEEESVSTSKSTAKLTAVVTDVMES